MPVATARRILLAGHGAALLAPGTVRTELASGLLLDVGVVNLPKIPTSGALVTHHGHGQLSGLANLLLAALRAAAPG